MKPIHDMTDPERNATMLALAEKLEPLLPPGASYFLLATSGTKLGYVTSIYNEDLIKELRRVADKLEGGEVS